MYRKNLFIKTLTLFCTAKIIIHVFIWSVVHVMVFRMKILVNDLIANWCKDILSPVSMFPGCFDPIFWKSKAADVLHHVHSCQFYILDPPIASDSYKINCHACIYPILWNCHTSWGSKRSGDILTRDKESVHLVNFYFKDTKINNKSVWLACKKPPTEEAKKAEWFSDSKVEIMVFTSLEKMKTRL